MGSARVRRWWAAGLTAGLGAAVAALLSACAVGPSGTTTSSRLQVVTTVLPVTLFTRAVAGPCATVTPLMGPQTNPHDFQARPADLIALQRARVLVINGLGIETFLDKLIRSAANPQLRLINSSTGVATLAIADPRQSHGHGHDHAAVNPHVWLDPRRAIQQLQTIRDGLIKADPACAEGYRTRAAAAVAALERLDRDLASGLQPYRGRTFVVFHDFAPYFAQRYRLRALAVVDVPEQDPTPAQLAAVVAEVKGSQLGALMTSRQQRSSAIQTLAADLGVGVSVFDPLETTQSPKTEGLELYIRVMRRNASELIAAFAANNGKLRHAPQP
jgi:zinc transport system substrate-binding protein